MKLASFISAISLTAFSLSAQPFSIFAADPAPAQTEWQQQAVKQALTGKHFLVTYREGGVIYGTYYLRDVYFCPSRYRVQGQSQKQTVLGNTQVNSLNDSGTWDVATIAGRVALVSRSDSGQVNALPIALLPNGGIWLGDGVTVLSRGPALCH
jgi:hypothetical protein